MTHRNDNVVELLQFSYENDNSTARFSRREGSNQPFLDGIYIETKLDTELADAIDRDQFDLVVLTGNPGDGKTAFMDRLAKRGRTRANRPVEFLHDATQPEDDDRTALAESYLELFLRDFTDSNWNPTKAKQVVRVVGINEGMLARTLLNAHGPYARQMRKILQAVKHRRDPGQVKVAYINLNERALVHLPLGSSSGLLQRLVERLASEEFWEHGDNGQGCAGCPAEAVCPLLTNARHLRRNRPRRQLELLFAATQFRRQRHVALRDALAALAYVLVGHEDMFRGGTKGTGAPIHPCDFVQTRAREERWGLLFRRLFYHAALFDGDVFEGYFGALGEEDEASHRLFGFGNDFVVDQLGALDPVRHASNSALDAIEIEVVSNPIGVIRDQQAGWLADAAQLERRFFERFTTGLDEVEARLTEGDVPDQEFDRLREKFARLSYVASRFARRRAFFFDENLGDGDATPYESLPEFLGALAYLAGSNDQEAVTAFEGATEKTIPGGIIVSERIPAPAPSSTVEVLRVRLGDARGSVGARLEFHIDDLAGTLLLPGDARIGERYDYRPPANAERFVEYYPTFLVYRPFASGSEHLLVTLDLYELLFRLRRGFSEAFGGQLRTQQLRAFKSAVKARESSKFWLFDEEVPGLSVQATVRKGRGDRALPRITFQ